MELSYSQMLKTLQDKCVEKLQCSQGYDEKKLQCISEILAQEDCFKKIDAKVALNILLDLGYLHSDAVELYAKIIESI